MEWTRTPTDWANDPRVHAIADALNVDAIQVVGHLYCIWSKLPEFARDGVLASVAPSLLEQWAVWRGKRGAFAVAFHVHMLDATQRWVLWEELNGAVLREKDADRRRQEERRRVIREAQQQALDAKADRTAKALADGLADTLTDSPAKRPAASPAKRPADGRTDGPPLRNERTKYNPSGAHARGHGHDSAPRGFRPGDANLPPAPWCAECGDGETAENAKGRLVRVHQTSCSHYVALQGSEVAS